MAQITQEDLQAALPDVTCPMEFGALTGSVDVYRDSWGIPHIRAERETDLFFAQGFVTAQDRLWHMDLDRHQALGRWAEFAGPSVVARDRLLRAAGMGRTAKLDYEVASVSAKAMVDAYTAGVNAFLDTAAQLPVEYQLLEERPEPWENWHCLAVYKIRNTLLGTFEPKLFRTLMAERIGPEKMASFLKGYPHGHLVTVPPGETYAGDPLDGTQMLQKATEMPLPDAEDQGSNAWAISGRLTATGMPLMGGDSHRGLDTPSVYYQIHLSCPGFTVIGHSVPGMPGALHFCHNEYVGWGMTYGSADTQDLFVERFREQDGVREYEFRGEWRPAEVLQETLHVRGADPMPMEVTITHHGPVIAGDPSKGVGIAITDPGLIEGTRWVDSARDAMQATSVSGLREAFRDWTDRVNNYAVVDVQGDFGYIHAGKIPIRGEENGWTAVPGWTGEHEWQGYIPHEELPSAINPEQGYVVSCNQRVAPHDYPYYVGLYASPEFRARWVQTRILELVPGTATLDDMAKIHAELISNPARIFTKALLQVDPPDADCETALSALSSWDGRMDRDLVAPTIYSMVRLCATRWLVRHLLGDLAESVLAGLEGGEAHIRLIGLEMFLEIERGDAALLPAGMTWKERLGEALREAVVALKDRLGADQTGWTWGRLHHTQPGHALASVFPEAASLLNPPGFAVHGDGDTPLAGSYVAHDPFSVVGLSVNRYLHDSSDWTNSRWIVPLGASGHPGSSHFSDQAALWADVAYIPQLWDWAQIEAEAESYQYLKPA